MIIHPRVTHLDKTIPVDNKSVIKITDKTLYPNIFEDLPMGAKRRSYNSKISDKDAEIGWRTVQFLHHFKWLFD